MLTIHEHEGGKSHWPRRTPETIEHEDRRAGARMRPGWTTKWDLVYTHTHTHMERERKKKEFF